MYVYLIRVQDTNLYKIGSSKNPKGRMKSLQTANGAPLELINSVKCEHYWKVEKAMHRKFNSKLTMGEWFSLEEGDVISFKEECLKKDESFKLLFSENSYVQEHWK